MSKSDEPDETEGPKVIAIRKPPIDFFSKRVAKVKTVAIEGPLVNAIDLVPITSVVPKTRPFKQDFFAPRKKVAVVKEVEVFIESVSDTISAVEDDNNLDANDLITEDSVCEISEQKFQDPSAVIEIIPEEAIELVVSTRASRSSARANRSATLETVLEMRPSRVNRARKNDDDEDEYLDKANSFFMTRKEKKEHLASEKLIRDEKFKLERAIQIEQFQIEKQMKLKSDVSETSNLVNRIIQGKALNPFFNPREFKQVLAIEKSSDICISLNCPWPTSEQTHVGWTPLNLNSIPTINHIWKRRSGMEPFKELQILPMISLSLSAPPVRLQSRMKMTQKEQIIDLLTIEYSGDSLQSSHLFDLLKALNNPMPKKSNLWKDAFTPNSVDTILGANNQSVCQQVLGWLSTWTTNPEIFSSFKQKGKKQKKKYDFIADEDEEEDEYLDTDCDEPRISDCRPVLMLKGGPGSGKTMIAHLAAQISGYHVIELNTSDKRSGKTLQDLLTNASTIYSMKKHRFGVVDDIAKGVFIWLIVDTSSKRGKTMILLDDADVNSEDEKGFWSGLLSIIVAARCPILLTCTENPLTGNNHHIISGLMDLVNAVQIYNLNIPSYDEIVMYSSLIACNMGVYLTRERVIEVIGSKRLIGSSIDHLQLFCSDLQDRSIHSWCQLANEEAPQKLASTSNTISEISERLTSVSRLDFLQIDEESELGEDGVLEIMSIDKDPALVFQHLIKHSEDLLMHFTGPALELQNASYLDRLQVYDSLYPLYQIYKIPRLVATELLPFLSLGCRFDDPGGIQGTVERENGNRRTRSKKVVSLHFCDLEADDHAFIGSFL